MLLSFLQTEIETENLNFGVWKLRRIADILDFQYSEACKGKKAIFGCLEQP